MEKESNHVLHDGSSLIAELNKETKPTVLSTKEEKQTIQWHMTASSLNVNKHQGSKDGTLWFQDAGGPLKYSRVLLCNCVTAEIMKVQKSGSLVTREQ